MLKIGLKIVGLKKCFFYTQTNIEDMNNFYMKNGYLYAKIKNVHKIFRQK